MADRTATERQRRRGLHTGSKQWRCIREQVLAWEPLCRYCGDVATEVDHLDNDTFNNTIDNLAATCKPCHSSKTAREMQGKAGQWGCDPAGFPLDPDHPWNLENRQSDSANGTRTFLPFIANGADE